MAGIVVGYVGEKKPLEKEPVVIDVEPTKVEPIKPKKTTKK